jgi:hypothetical protein
MVLGGIVLTMIMSVPAVLMPIVVGPCFFRAMPPRSDIP